MGEENIITVDKKNIFNTYYLGNHTYLVKHIIKNNNNESFIANSWQQKMPFDKNYILEEEHLLMISNVNNTFNGVYDYKNKKFIIPIGLFDNLSYSNKNKVFLGTFTILSSPKDDDFISYLHPITGEEISKCFRLCGDTYHGIINKDGTLKGNLINENINEIVIFSDCKSISEFKKQEIKKIDEKREKIKNEFIIEHDKELVDKGYSKR